MSPLHADAMQGIRRIAASRMVAEKWVRPLLWLAGALFAALSATYPAPRIAWAGTVTIVDGPNTPPVNGVYTDGYIQAQLATNDLIITTTGAPGQVDEIRVLKTAVISWTTGSALVLNSAGTIVVTGTIQHDGPANGAGGLSLLASTDPSGAVTVGTGAQSGGVAVGSRHGLTRVHAGNLVLQGGASGTVPFALLGFRAFDEGAAYTVTGPISVTVSQNITAVGGIDDYAFVQIGHGGAINVDASPPSGQFTGNIDVDAGGNASFIAGEGAYAYAQLGNGGVFASGNHGGNHTLKVDGDVTFQGNGRFTYAQFGNGAILAEGDMSGSHQLNAGGDVTFLSGDGDYAYTQMGNGGNNTVGNHSGNHTLNADGNVTFQAGAGFAFAYAHLGNGGYEADGNHSGGHTVNAAGNVTFLGGLAFAQLGNGGDHTDGNHSGDHQLNADGNVSFRAGTINDAYALLGNGGNFAAGSHSGDHVLNSGGDVTFQGGFVFAQLGNGGFNADGNHSGDHALNASGDVTFEGGDDNYGNAQMGNGGSGVDGNQSGDNRLDAGGDVILQGGTRAFTFAQFGSGGALAKGNLGGSLALTTTGSLTMTAGSGSDAYAMLGHGGDIEVITAAMTSGVRAGDIRVHVGDTAVFSGSQVGHVTISGTLSITQGNTLIGVSQNNPAPSGSGELLVMGVTTTTFSSAPEDELRFYLPREDSQQVPLNATFNGATFATANTIPPAQLAGEALFGEGPYIEPYSFYVGLELAALTITKTVVGAAPGSAWQFAGSGAIGSFTLPAGGGSKSFAGLIPATYTISETTQAGYISEIACSNGASGTESVSVSLAAGVSVGCIFTNTKSSTPTGGVVGLVFEDGNGDGLPDAGEGLAGVTVTLESEAGVAAALTLTDVTDNNGEYGFANVPVGNYPLRFDPPVGYTSIDDAQVTVVSGQTVNAPDREAVKEGTGGAGTLYLPALQR